MMDDTKKILIMQKERDYKTVLWRPRNGARLGDIPPIRFMSANHNNVGDWKNQGGC